MAQPESRLSRSIISKLMTIPEVFAWKNHGSEFTMSGLPDVMVIYKGQFIGLEVKMPDKRDDVSDVQHYVHDRLREAGARVYVVCSISEAIACIRLNPEEPGAMRMMNHPSSGNPLD